MSYKGINPALWGPTLWRIIHRIAAFFDKYKYQRGLTVHTFKTLMVYIYILIPCKFCRDALNKTLTQNRDLNIQTLTKRVSFKKYTFKLHRDVSIQLNKPKLFSYQQVYKEMFALSELDASFHRFMDEFIHYVYENGRPTEHILYNFIALLISIDPDNAHLHNLQSQVLTHAHHQK